MMMDGAEEGDQDGDGGDDDADDGGDDNDKYEHDDFDCDYIINDFEYGCGCDDIISYHIISYHIIS